MKKRLIIGIYIFGIITIVNSHYSFAADLNVQESTSLKTLNVTVGNLEPSFSKDITEYNLKNAGIIPAFLIYYFIFSS